MKKRNEKDDTRNVPRRLGVESTKLNIKGRGGKSF